MVLINNFIDNALGSVKNQISDDFTHIDFGTGTTTPTISDSVMENSIVRNARQDISILSDSVVVSGFLGSGQANGEDISEIGAFDAGSGGNMQDHSLITAVTKTSSKELWVDIRNNIKVTQS